MNPSALTDTNEVAASSSVAESADLSMTPPIDVLSQTFDTDPTTEQADKQPSSQNDLQPNGIRLLYLLII